MPTFTSQHLQRARAVAAVALAAVLLMIWWAGQASADQDRQTVHVCAADNGALRLSEDCNRAEDAFTLATGAGLAASESHIDALEAEVAKLRGGIDALQRKADQQADTIVELVEANDKLESLLDGVSRGPGLNGMDTLVFGG